MGVMVLIEPASVENKLSVMYNCRWGDIGLRKGFLICFLSVPVFPHPEVDCIEINTIIELCDTYSILYPIPPIRNMKMSKTSPKQGAVVNASQC